MEDAVLKYKMGVTSAKEIIRVFGIEAEEYIAKVDSGEITIDIPELT
jgi:hypothetical protein